MQTGSEYIARGPAGVKTSVRCIGLRLEYSRQHDSHPIGHAEEITTNFKHSARAAGESHQSHQRSALRTRMLPQRIPRTHTTWRGAAALSRGRRRSKGRRRPAGSLPTRLDGPRRPSDWPTGDEGGERVRRSRRLILTPGGAAIDRAASGSRVSLIHRLHDRANVQQTFSKCIQNTCANCSTFAGSCKRGSSLSSLACRRATKISTSSQSAWHVMLRVASGDLYVCAVASGRPFSHCTATVLTTRLNAADKGPPATWFDFSVTGAHLCRPPLLCTHAPLFALYLPLTAL